MVCRLGLLLNGTEVGEDGVEFSLPSDESAGLVVPVLGLWKRLFLTIVLPLSIVTMYDMPES